MRARSINAFTSLMVSLAVAACGSDAEDDAAAAGSGGATAGIGGGGNAPGGAGGTTAGTGGGAGMAAASSGGVTPPPPGDCVGDWMPGAYPADFITGGGTSTMTMGALQYAVHVSSKYDCRVPMPLVFCLHGLAQTGFSFCVNGTSTPDRMGGFPAKADEEGFIVVMTTGAQPNPDHVTTLRAIFEDLATHLNIDRKRVYATGHSFGGYLSFLLACTAADMFTAVAPNAGSQGGACNPSQPISVLASHGTADTIVPYASLAPSVASIVTANGCSATSMPATVPASGGDTSCLTYPDCDGGVEVTSCTIEGGGHTWFGDPTCGTGSPGACGFVGANSEYYVNTDFAWDFFKRLSR